MVRKYDIHGGVYHEPPYTKGEEQDFYRRMGSVVAFTRPEPKPKPVSERKVRKRGA